MGFLLMPHVYILNYDNWPLKEPDRTLKASNILKSYTAQSVNADGWLRDEAGRPCLLGSDVDMSVTHENSLAMAVVSSFRVGIDLCSAKCIFSPTECEELFGQSIPLSQFPLYWSAREAYIKYHGRFLEHVTVKKVPHLDRIQDLELPWYRVADFGTTARAEGHEPVPIRFFKYRSLIGAIASKDRTELTHKLIDYGGV